ncbi:MAG: hypothetical protein ACREP6_10915 [Candidatus Binataceae bacterium]
MPAVLKNIMIRALWTCPLIFILAMIPSAAAAAAQSLLNFPPTRFKIYNDAGTRVIGNGEYRLEPAPSGEAYIHGEDHYKNGEYDIEDDILKLHPNGRLPTLTSFRHTFYHPDGSTMLLASIDVKTGKASCIDFGPKGAKSTVTLKPPADTYAGAALLVPISEALRMKRPGPIALHVFDCIPAPKVIALSAYATGRHQWSFYPGKLVQMEAKPELGWLDLLVAPFVPRVHAWFDPAQDYDYVGGRIHRYLYGNEHVVLVKTEADRAAAAKNVARISKPSDGAQPPLDSPKK